MGLKRLRPNLCARALAYILGRGKLLPDILVDETGSERSFTARLCTAAGLREACDLTRRSYGSAYVSHDIAEQWRLRDPLAFVQIMNPENRLCACFGVLALRESFMDQFIAGLLTDQDIRGEHVCSIEESKPCSRLYVSGVVVLEPTSYKGRKRAAVMFWAMLEYIRRVYDLKTPRRLYAVAVTQEAGQLMRNLGFVVEVSAANRKDNYDLYRYNLTDVSWDRLLCELNDCSRMCTIDLTLANDVPAFSGETLHHVPTAKTTDGKHRILFIAGDRGGGQRNQAQTPREYSVIKEAIQSGTNRDSFEIAPPILGANRQALVEAYREHPMILHFAGHGDDRSLSLVIDQGAVVNETQLLAEQLVTILKNFPIRVRLCVLNTCESAPLAEQLAASDAVDAAVGWSTKLSDDAAIGFSKALYGRLCDGLDLSRSVILAHQASGTPTVPSLYTADGVDLHVTY